MKLALLYAISRCIRLPKPVSRRRRALRIITTLIKYFCTWGIKNPITYRVQRSNVLVRKSTNTTKMGFSCVRYVDYVKIPYTMRRIRGTVPIQCYTNNFMILVNTWISIYKNAFLTYRIQPYVKYERYFQKYSVRFLFSYLSERILCRTGS
jgi:hypothetical protein